MTNKSIISSAQFRIQTARAELVAAERLLSITEESPQRERPTQQPTTTGRRPGRPIWRPLRLPHVDWEAGEVVAEVQPGQKNAIGKAIVDAMHAGGGTVKVSAGNYGEQKVTYYGARSASWDALGMCTTVNVICEDGTTIAGMQVHGRGYDLLVQNFTLTFGTGAQMMIGSTGGDIALRLRDVNAMQPAFTNKPIKWLMRPYGIMLQLEKCDFTGAIAQEHNCYLDTCWAVIANKTKFGPAGRTHVQFGTREESATLYYRSERWPGVMIQDCEGVGLNSGAGGGSGITCWGYPGPVQIDGWHMRSNSPEHVITAGGDKVVMNENRCFSTWRATNYGGVIMPVASSGLYATPFLSIDNVTCDYPSMDRPLGEIESAGEVWLGKIEGKVRKPWIDAPDQWNSGPVGKVSWISGDYARIDVRIARTEAEETVCH